MDSSTKASRNIIITSFVLWLAYLGQIEFLNESNSFPIFFSFSNPDIIIKLIWVIWIFNTWRYWQYTKGLYRDFCKNLKQYILSQEYFIKLLSNKAKQQQPSINDKAGERIKNKITIKGFLVIVIEHSGNGNGLEETLRFTLSPLSSHWYKVIDTKFRYVIKNFISNEKVATAFLPYVAVSITLLIYAYSKMFL